MSHLSLTRMSLLRRRAEATMARRGMEILKTKRDALLRELYRAAGKALEFRQKAAALASRAATALALAAGVEGEESLRSLAGVARRDVLVGVEVRNVWGVRIPLLSSVPTARRSVDRGHGLVSTSAAVDEAAEAHEKLLAFVLEQAPQEIRLRRLAAELRRTSRKVNTLEREVIPRLLAEARRIEFALEEEEREDRFRLELLKGGQP